VHRSVVSLDVWSASNGNKLGFWCMLNTCGVAWIQYFSFGKRSTCVLCLSVLARFGNKRLFCPILPHDVSSLLLPIHVLLPYLHDATTFTREQKLSFLYSMLSSYPVMEGTLALQIWRKRAFGLPVDVRSVPLKTSRQRVFHFLPNSPRKWFSS
jgi:hypothetical protein